MGDRGDRAGSGVNFLHASYWSQGELPLWIKGLGSLGPLIVAALVAQLGYRQCQWNRRQAQEQQTIARQKVTINLFDRRNVIYANYRKLEREIGDCFSAPGIALCESLSDETASMCLDARFLFAQPVLDFIHELAEKNLALGNMKAELSGTEGFYNDEFRNDQKLRKRKIRRDILTSFHAADNIFRPAMAIDFY